MEVTLAVLADAANSSENGKLNLLGVFQSIFSAQVPCTHPQMYVVAVVRLDVDEKGTPHEFSVRLLDEDARVLGASANLTFAVPTTDPRPTPDCNFIIELRSLQFPCFGQYLFEICIDGECQRTLSLDIQQMAKPPAA